MQRRLVNSKSVKDITANINVVEIRKATYQQQLQVFDNQLSLAVPNKLTLANHTYRQQVLLELPVSALNASSLNDNLLHKHLHSAAIKRMENSLFKHELKLEYPQDIDLVNYY